MLNQREQVLLKALVEAHIREGMPVGSKMLARESGLDLSAATVRNVMADLEQMGFLNSPHTSAGRIPTAKGYRYFVDSLNRMELLPQGMADDLRQRFGTLGLAPKAVADAVSQVLAEMTQMVGLVTIPKENFALIHRIELMPLSENRILAVLVYEDDEVQNRIIKVERPELMEELRQTSSKLNEYLCGKSLLAAREFLVETLAQTRAVVSDHMEMVIDIAQVLFADSNDYDGLSVQGQSNLMAFDELSHLQKLKALFDAFTEQGDLLHLLDQCVQAPGVKIYIGEESGYQVLDDCTMITAPYVVQSRVLGVLGVIGPSRMEYRRIIPMVDATARLLGDALNYSS